VCGDGAGALKKGIYSDSPVIPMVYAVMGEDYDLAKRIFRSFCRIIHAYGFHEFVAVVTAQDEYARIERVCR
jgi:hypothetical protein